MFINSSTNSFSNTSPLLLWKQPSKFGKLFKTPNGTQFRIREAATTYIGAISKHEMAFTKSALAALIDFAASKPPEIGGLGFGPYDRMGIEHVELDVLGSARSSSSIYRNDGAWGIARQNFYMEKNPRSTLQMIWHTHPGSCNEPSGKAGKARGDLAMFEEFFEGNESAELLYCPILTVSDGIVHLNPWIAQRSRSGVIVGLAPLNLRNIEDMRPALFNPTWEESVSQAACKREYTKRLSGIVSEKFRDKTILMVGVGAGSYQAEKLARYMPKKLIFIDPDVVEVSNLSRTSFSMIDAISRKPKVEALRERIAAINPFVEVEAIQGTLSTTSPTETRRLFQCADVIIEGTDSFESKRLTNQLAREYRRPAIFIGIHAGADSGRIIIFEPGHSPCYECVAKERYVAALAKSETDLAGQAGAVVEIQLIDMVALKIAVGMIDAGDSKMSRFYKQLRTQGSEVIIRTTRDSSFGTMWFNALLSDLPHQPKNYAQELSSYFVGVDATAIHHPFDDKCLCNIAPQARTKVYAA